MALIQDLSQTNIIPIAKPTRALDKREIADAFRKAILAVQELQTAVSGASSDLTGKVTLVDGTDFTVISDPLITADSILTMGPQDSVAASMDSNWYQGLTAAGSIRIEHSDMTTDRVYGYIIRG